MDENHPDAAGRKLKATDDIRWVLNRKSKLWVPKPKKPFAQRMGFAGKTPWDLIQLLLIPLVLAVIGYWFTATQTQISLQSSQKQHDTDLQIAVNQQRETTLKTCLDDIKDLLLNKNLRASKPQDEVRVVARVEVLAALRQLDGERKGLLMQFLSEAELINKLTNSSRKDNDVIISLRDADLFGADLSADELRYADLLRADLRNAHLRKAHLLRANLIGADLSDADLSWADLPAVDLSVAHLRAAHLSGAYLPGAYLIGADLSAADLREADLREANLDAAHLIGADLRAADLREANLSAANLRFAIITQAQLNEAKSLKGATMPDGSKHP